MNEKSTIKDCKEYFENHMIFSVFTIVIIFIVVFSLIKNMISGLSGNALLLFILKVIFVIIILFIIKQLIDVFEKKRIIDLRDL